jgi:hypothetical protein
VQEVVGHDYLVHCASFLVQIFRQKKLWHEEDKRVSALAADDRSFGRDEAGAHPDKGFDRSSDDLADIPGGLGKLEVGEVVAVADEDGMDGEENSAAAEAAEDNEAGFVEEVMDLVGKESDAEDVGELVGGDMAIEHQQGVRRDQPGMELGDKAFELLVLVMTE